MISINKHYILAVFFGCLTTSTTLSARTITVNPGQSIRAVVATARPGDIVRVKPGTYKEGAPGDINAITITQNGIGLIGESTPKNPVILLNNGGSQNYGIWVSPIDTTGVGQNDIEHPPCASSGRLVNGFTLQGFTVKGFAVHGVHLACVRGFDLSNNIADGNQVYGLFPIVSQQGIVANNEAKNTPFDAAIYVGQSRNIVVSGNKTHDSLIGIELENSQACTLIGNQAKNNTVGILIDSAPGLTRPLSQGNFVTANNVVGNNLPSQSPEGFPVGIGILVTAANTTTLLGNRVSDNHSSGIVVSSFICPASGCGDPTFDPTSNGNRITANILSNNGLLPDPLIGPFAADLAWDFSGSSNCWSLNQFNTSFPSTLASCN
jgi:parallel beta-helix repeat protein